MEQLKQKTFNLPERLIIQLLLGKKHYKELEVDFYLGGP